MLQGCLNSVIRVFERCYRDANELYKDVTGLLQGCYNGVTELLEGTFPVLFKNFPDPSQLLSWYLPNFFLGSFPVFCYIFNIYLIPW